MSSCASYLDTCRAACGTAGIYDYRCADSTDGGVEKHERQCQCMPTSSVSVSLSGASCDALDDACYSFCSSRRMARKDADAPCYSAEGVMNAPCQCDECEQDNLPFRVLMGATAVVAGMTVVALSLSLARAKRGVRVSAL